MTAWALLDEAGCVREAFAADDAAIPPGAVALPAMADLRGATLIHRGPDGDWHARPVLPAPVETAAGVAATGVPEGAELVATDRGTAAELVAPAVDGAAEIALPADGAWTVQVRGPGPWLPSAELAVTRGGGSAAFAAGVVAAAKQAAIARVNAAVGAARARFITVAPGQELIYSEKQKEAARFMALPVEPPVLDEYPFLRREVGHTAPTAYQLSQLWLNQAALLAEVGSLLEEVRLPHIYAIETAASEAEIAAVEAAFQLALQGVLQQVPQ